MWFLSSRLCLAGLALVLASSAAVAQCTEDRRQLSVGDGVVQLRTYLCRTGDGADAARVRIEIHRLSDLAASITVANRRSEMLTRVIGSPRFIANEVSTTYSDLLRQFGTTVGRDLTIQQLKVDGAGAGGTGSSSQDKVDDGIRILGDAGFQNIMGYPAIAEIDALQRKIIPPGLRYFYAITCLDKDASSDGDTRATCPNFDPTLASMRFWRGMKADDAANYSRRMTAYNRRFLPREQARPVAIPRELRLASHVAGNNWPDDFMIMDGSGEMDGCDAGHFWYSPRAFMLDVAIIENLSRGPINVGNILGGRPTEKALRVATSSSSLASSGQPLGILVGTLASEQKALVPLRIFLAPHENTVRAFRYRQSAALVYRRLGASGYGGNVGGFGAPSFKSYAWGPEIVIGGLIVNGTRIDLTNRSANYVEMTQGAEAGSCPYLLSQAKDGEWIEHGKVLHKAPSRDREYSEERSFPGFRARFRIEEREPEIAFLDQAQLVVTLQDGSTRTLAPDNPRLAARDGDYLRLIWGDAVDINFALPQGIAEDDVIESRFAVTGYYLRYSDRMAQDGADMPASSRPALSRGAMSIPAAPSASRASAAACPVPAKLDPFVAGAP